MKSDRQHHRTARPNEPVSTSEEIELGAGRSFPPHTAAQPAFDLRALRAIAAKPAHQSTSRIEAALRLGLEQLDLDWAFFGIIDSAAQELVVQQTATRTNERALRPVRRAPLAHTLLGGPDATDVVAFRDVTLSGMPFAYPGRSYIAVPVCVGGAKYAALGFLSRDVRPQPFSQMHIDFLTVAGELIGAALEASLRRECVTAGETPYRALTEAIPQMVWVIDAAGNFEYVNARWTDYTGLTLEASRTLGYAGSYDAAQLACIRAHWGGDPPHEHDCEVPLRRADGAHRWHLVRSVPFADSAGDAGKFLVTATDIEERKSADALMTGVHDAALAATQAKSRFLATMSHEIRTPMNAVIGMTELLLLTQLSGEQREYIEIVRDSGQSLLRVLNDILDYSKIEAGKLELENVDFDLGGQMESVVELLRAQYHIKGVQLRTYISAGVPPVVCGDPGRLRQILLNLAGNALKFTPAGGSVTITISATPADGDAVPIHFTVQDTGIGIPPPVVARLFQPFSQGDESTTRKYGGTGLGLSICAQLVALMNGTIGVNSLVGVGSAFWFAIPLRPVRPSPEAHAARKREPERAKPVIMRAERILLVEDNEINTFLALKQLQRLGFIVNAVHNGQQAVEAVAHERFDLVLMDCHMPEMDGFAATRAIRGSETGSESHLPIVAMTADARTEDHQNCLLAGMDDYISKPTSLESLRNVLDRWLPTPDRRQNSRNGGALSGPAARFGVSELLELFDGDRAAVITLLGAAAGSIKTDFARIENCAVANDATGLTEAAHRLKGTSASIRAPRLAQIGTAIERMAAADATLDAALLEELREAVDALMLDVEKQSKFLETIG